MTQNTLIILIVNKVGLLIIIFLLHLSTYPSIELAECVCECVRMNMCVCVHLAELSCSCVLVRAMQLYCLGYVCVYVGMYVIECVRVIACRHASVWQSG